MPARLSQPQLAPTPVYTPVERREAVGSILDSLPALSKAGPTAAEPKTYFSIKDALHPQVYKAVTDRCVLLEGGARG